MDKQNPQAGPLCRREPTREQRFQGGGVEKTQQSLVKCGMPASPVTSLNSSIHRTRPSLPLSVSHEPAGLYLPSHLPFPSVPLPSPMGCHLPPTSSFSLSRLLSRTSLSPGSDSTLPPNFLSYFLPAQTSRPLTHCYHVPTRSSPLASLSKSLPLTAGSHPWGTCSFPAHLTHTSAHM